MSATQTVASAERFTLTPFTGHCRFETLIGTYVSHDLAEATGTDGTLHQVIVTKVDDDTVRVTFSFEGDDVYAGVVDTFRKTPEQIRLAVEALVAQAVADEAQALLFPVTNETGWTGR